MAGHTEVTLFPTRHTQGARRPVGFGATSRVNRAEHYIAKNQIVNRTVIETLGYTFWAVLFARNNFERNERMLDWLMWTAVGALVLPATGRALNRQGLTALKKLGVTSAKALETPFEDLERKTLSSATHRAALMKSWGLKSAKNFEAVSRLVVRRKLMVVGMNLLLLAAKGQIFFWGKNLLTEYLSGRKGFVGEFKIADTELLKKKALAEEHSKRFRQIVSVAAGITAVIAAPLWIYTLLNASAKGPMARLKKLIPLYNYQDAIYLSKAVLIFHNLFNWFLPSVLSARDKDERREVIAKSIAFDFFYFFGDALIASGVAAWMKTRAATRKALGRYDIMAPRKNFLGIRMAKDYSTVMKDIERKVAPKAALQFARINFWSGILGTSVFLGIMSTTLNNWYTEKKVRAEMAKAKPAKRLHRIPRQPV